MSTYTFSENQITASGTNYISFTRFKLDDVDVSGGSTTAELSDEVITALYNETSADLAQIERNFLTALKAAEYLATKYRKQATFSSAGTSMQLKERAEAWQEFVNDLRLQYMQVSSLSNVLYPYRPHYNDQVLADESGWIDINNW